MESLINKEDCIYPDLDKNVVCNNIPPLMVFMRLDMGCVFAYVVKIELLQLILIHSN